MQSWRMNQLFYNIFNMVVFVDVTSVHNGNKKHVRTIEFDYTKML